MAIPIIKTSFAGGEISPELWGHVDSSKVMVGVATGRNGFVNYKGGFNSRAGTLFVGFSKQTGRTVPPRLLTFQFSILQGLCLEFGNNYMRVVSNGAFVTESGTLISGITQASPAVVTDVAHGYVTNDWIFIFGVSGMAPINGQIYVITVIDADHYSLADVYGNPIDSTGFPAYAGGGVAERIFTLVTPWSETDLEFLKFTESADVMTICCWNQETGTDYQPYDLARLADDNWTLTPITTQVNILPPSGGSGSASNTGTTDYNYVVTAVAASGEESIASPIIDIPLAVDIAATLGSIEIGWAAVTGAAHYNIYKAPPAFQNSVPTGSLFGYAGSSYGGLFVDGNILPDFSQVPPLHVDPFAPGAIASITIINPGAAITSAVAAIMSGTGSGFSGFPVINGGQLAAYVVVNGGIDYLPGDTITFTVNGGATPPIGALVVGPQSGTYPSVVSYFQQRRVFAAPPNSPDTYFMSQPGLFYNFDSRFPTIDSDAIIGTPWSVQVNGIQFMVSMPGGLVALTGLSAWQLTGAGGSSLNPQPITPANQQAQPQAYNGCSATVPPIKIDYDIIYVQAKGSILRDLSYNFFTNIYTGVDITFLASQLFTGYTIREMAWCEEPNKLLWATRNDGTMLSLTFLKSQEVMAWMRHDTNGLFWSVTSVTEPPVDALYMATQRFIGP